MDRKFGWTAVVRIRRFIFGGSNRSLANEIICGQLRGAGSAVEAICSPLAETVTRTFSC